MTTTLQAPTRWRLQLPEMFLLNDNQRLHYRKKADHIAAIRQATALIARNAKVPALDRIHVYYLIHPGKVTRRRDPGNWSPSAKAAIDGLVDAGVVPDDNSAHVLGPDPRLGQPAPNIRMELVITDLTTMPASHIALLTPGDPA